jgi:hypothetical protein
MAAEAAIQKRSIAFAKSLGAESIRMVFRSGVARGWPDVLFLVPGGRPLFIEFKKPGALPTPLQAHRISAMEALGYDVCVADSFDKARAAIARAVGRAQLSAQSRPVPR